MTDYIKAFRRASNLLRIKQWVKNFFIFFPLLFSGQFFDGGQLLNCLIVFCGFCLVSSGIYVFNDLLDIKKDRLHPRKKFRPLAQEGIDQSAVWTLIIFLIVVGLWTCNVGGYDVFLLAFSYIGLQLFYNFYVKRVVLLDVIFLAIGFQVRIWLGALATGITPSVFLQVCVFLLALFLGFTKRRYELANLREAAGEHRDVLKHYTVYLLDQLIIICSTLAIVFYSLYAMSGTVVKRLGGEDLVYSVVFVVYGMFRYLYLVHVKKLGDDPGDILLSDAPLLCAVLSWVIFIIYLLYFKLA